MRVLKFLIFIFLLNIAFSFLVLSKDSPEFNVTSVALGNEKIKCQFLCLSKSKFALNLSKIIQEDLESTDQLEVNLKKYEKQVDPQVLSSFFQKGISLFVFLKEIPEQDENINIVIKDTSSNTDLFTQNFKVDTNDMIMGGHKIACKLMDVFIGDAGPFLSTIAYCKMLGPYKKIICLADYSFRKNKIIVPFKALNVAPSWHTKVPILYYSQFTRRNNRLMSVDLKSRKHKIVCSYDGLNMQPSFSKEGTKAVLCLSAGGNSELYLYDKDLCEKVGRRVFKKLTNNKSNNVSPTLLSNGDVIFCSDFQTGSPQIYYMNRKNKFIRRLTNGTGYCAAPSYCEKTNSIIYTRSMNRTFQLFSLNLNDFKNLREEQLTFDNGDKHEPSFSECGKYAIFSYCKRDEIGLKIPQIAVLNLNSGRIRVVTSGSEPKSYPVWTNKQFLHI